VLQNVLASVLCYDWGLGLATRFAGAGPWWVVALWAAVSAAVVGFALLWLRWSDRGPLELVAQRVVRGAGWSGAHSAEVASSSQRRSRLRGERDPCEEG
jgi:uncharacterized membrane protein YeiB